MKQNFYRNASEIWPMLDKEEYSFLKELDKTNTMLFVTLSGSRGYGTCLDFNTADYDFRGVMGHTKQELFGFADYQEQYVAFDKERDIDTTIYTLNKLVKLLLNCNPNTILLINYLSYNYT